jgi:tRNA(fMet)-specific endonuclease VapC
LRQYLLDTNVISGLMRDPRGRVFDMMMAVGEANIYTSVIVAAELRFGAAKRGSERLTTQVEAVLGRISVAPIGSPVDRIYAELRRHLESGGRPIGANDLWIACQALQDRSVLVTCNTGEFSRVPDLRLENWLPREATQ